ncbi:GDSL-type esterase/lipase family protein [Nocardia xishanensis]|uniref:GDSL-type esterase/lipase family protein n=1 Tax=Nocardia xishanensis TaxID=238964 RepID=A0ABW7X9Y0_9NOCA
MTDTDTITAIDRIRDRHGEAVRIGTGCDIANDVDLIIDHDATITLGNRVSIRRGTTLQANDGAHIVLGDDVAIGENVVISAMTRIHIGRGAGISNMVDIHDHNHRARTHATITAAEPITPWASGFEAAPIRIEPGAIVSNKVTITAGVTIGQNARIGANAVVTASIPPNTTAVGMPARVIARHPGPLDPEQPHPQLHMGWFGTSLMEHYEAHNPRLSTQADLPRIGEQIEVTEWRNRGYIHALISHWRTRYPWISFTSDNHGEGGATSRDVLANIRTAIDGGGRWDLTALGVGINDVWRHHQGRLREAVDIDEYDTNIRAALDLLTSRTRRLIVIGEPPIGWDPSIDVPAANTDLIGYNCRARRAAADAGVQFIDIWDTVVYAATCYGWSPTAPTAPAARVPSVWSDGVHLSELGDELLRQTIDQHVTDYRIIDDLLTLERLDRATARRIYTR